MCGIKVTLLAPLLVMILASMIRIVKRRTIRHVPLHGPVDGSRLHNNIIGAPILNNSLCEGMPLTSKVLRNLEGYVSPLPCPLQNLHWGSRLAHLEGSLKPLRLLAKPPCCEEAQSRAHANTRLWLNLHVVEGRWPQPWLVCPQEGIPSCLDT